MSADIEMFPDGGPLTLDELHDTVMSLARAYMDINLQLSNLNTRLHNIETRGIEE